MRHSKPAPSLRLAVLIALAICLARTTEAQDDRTGRLEGRVIDSTHARPLVDTRVVVVGMDARATMSGTASTDSAGRYHIDSLPPGRYAVGFESALLDSLEINLSARTVVVTPGRTATIDLALPPAAKLRGALCPGVTLPAQSGVIFGHVVDAESEHALHGAVLAMSWLERGVDRTTLRPVNRERTASATTDTNGWYRLCGVPTDTWLALQLQYMGRTGPVMRALVSDTLGIAVRHLSFDTSTARPASDSSATAMDSVASLLLSGTAMLSGIVRGMGDVPLTSAEVRVRDARATGNTDALGRYSLIGLPAGTQLLVVRHVGYAVAEIPVELRSGIVATRDVRLQRIVNLDSVHVVATHQPYAEFNKERKQSFLAVFFGPEEMEWRQRTTDVSDVIKLIPGYRIVGEGMKARVVNTRGGPFEACEPNIVIDGLEDMSINDVAPLQIGAIAAYRKGDSGPLKYDRGCGAIVIWTKRMRY